LTKPEHIAGCNWRQILSQLEFCCGTYCSWDTTAYTSVLLWLQVHTQLLYECKIHFTLRTKLLIQLQWSILYKKTLQFTEIKFPK